MHCPILSLFPTANINSISTLSILTSWQKSPGGLSANQAYQSHHRLGLFFMETAILPSYSTSFILLQKATMLSILKCKTFLRYYYSLQNTSILLFKEMFAGTNFHTSYHLPELLSFIKKFTVSCLYSQSLIHPFWFKLTLSFFVPTTQLKLFLLRLPVPARLLNSTVKSHPSFHW